MKDATWNWVSKPRDRTAVPNKSGKIKGARNLQKNPRTMDKEPVASMYDMLARGPDIKKRDKELTSTEIQAPRKPHRLYMNAAGRGMHIEKSVLTGGGNNSARK
eukprot:CAMPEP_0184663224 /NCGR_PEP_ID=MMETSP0308-20130426/47153_1 /TAXON_ID=38269 /ORGANISM="Gloeochaete witrockiana, Strain SAG 46.84" /LENGTH=103 /DNA_ID=CAMNT_0027105809 /DNA_START=454 /DNA_END=765 /DNA_ORIENTATION=+